MTQIHPAQEIVIALGAEHSPEEALRLLDDLEKSLTQRPIRADECAQGSAPVLLLPSVALVNFNDMHDLKEDRHRRMMFAEICGRATYLLARESLDPLSVIEKEIGNAHTRWVAMVMDGLCDAEIAGRAHRNADGENLLHLLIRHSILDYHAPHEILRMYAGQSEGGHLHPDWLNAVRVSDGATPLHVLWCGQGGAPAHIKRARTSLESWQAYEVHSDAVLNTKALMELGADLDRENTNGESILDLMLAARQDGFWNWKPNVEGLDWVEPLLIDYEASLISKKTARPQGARASKRL